MTKTINEINNVLIVGVRVHWECGLHCGVRSMVIK